MLAKLGESYERVSAVFIWSYIKRMFSARDPSTAKEQLGHVAGGYKRVIKQITAKLVDSGSAIRTGVTVRRIEPDADGGSWSTTTTVRSISTKSFSRAP